MKMPEMFDNVSKTVKDDLTVTIKKGDKLSVAAACFSIYAYQALKKQLDGIDDCALFSPHLHFCERKHQKKSESSTSHALVASAPFMVQSSK
jgi:hypothetical protein